MPSHSITSVVNVSSSNDRSNALSHASTLDQVSELVPHNYKDGARASFKVLWDACKKHANAAAALAGLQRHKSLGTWPPALRGIKPATMQMSNHYQREAADASMMERQMADLAAIYRSGALDLMIAQKKDEVEWIYLQHLDRPNWLAAVQAAAKESYKAVKKSTMYRNPKDSGEPSGSSSSVTEYITPTWVDNEYLQWKKDFPLFGERVCSLARGKGLAKLEKKLAKVSLKEKADVEMADADTGNASSVQQSIADEVAKQVAAALKKAKGQSAPPNKGKGKQDKKPKDGKGKATEKLKPAKQSRSGKMHGGKSDKVEKKPSTNKGKGKAKQ
ncbi:hypothetical protein FN846DRAFT_1010526 [Sphaerosporella brunnea]|uniref:Uncharacterized protein n=1 Tax=Sphaerosporella brunnea TaxID=1250544 RepID=A0A5J5F027_9PEZI|nr:hypothetical protein FN846DRAFT_1010526 [Sphaerosporella brunnea]